MQLGIKIDLMEKLHNSRPRGVNNNYSNSTVQAATLRHQIQLQKEFLIFLCGNDIGIGIKITSK
jgi:hypothetical protein